MYITSRCQYLVICIRACNYTMWLVSGRRAQSEPARLAEKRGTGGSSIGPALGRFGYTQANLCFGRQKSPIDRSDHRWKDNSSSQAAREGCASGLHDHNVSELQAGINRNPGALPGTERERLSTCGGCDRPASVEHAPLLPERTWPHVPGWHCCARRSSSISRPPWRQTDVCTHAGPVGQTGPHFDEGGRLDWRTKTPFSRCQTFEPEDMLIGDIK
jgi:hypothetical protein